MSRAVRFHEIGGPEALRLEEVPDPTPGAGEVLIHTRALGLNRAESMFRLGEYGTRPGPTLRPRLRSRRSGRRRRRRCHPPARRAGRQRGAVVQHDRLPDAR